VVGMADPEHGGGCPVKKRLWWALRVYHGLRPRQAGCCGHPALAWHGCKPLSICCHSHRDVFWIPMGM
jgi:hypothetical protein